MSELQLNPGAERLPRDRVTALVAQILGPVDGARPLPAATRLNELGMSSMKMISLMLSIEVEFDLAIPQSDITPDNFDSIASIELLLVRLLASPPGM